MANGKMASDHDCQTYSGSRRTNKKRSELRFLLNYGPQKNKAIEVLHFSRKKIKMNQIIPSMTDSSFELKEATPKVKRTATIIAAINITK